jgi:hypothetical protein
MEIHRYSEKWRTNILQIPIFHVISQNSKMTSSNYKYRYFYFSADKPIHQYGYRCITRRVTQQGELLTQAGQTSSLFTGIWNQVAPWLPHNGKIQTQFGSFERLPNHLFVFLSNYFKFMQGIYILSRVSWVKYIALCINSKSGKLYTFNCSWVIRQGK